MWFTFSLAISVFDISVIIINCSFLSSVINIKRGSTPGIFILEGLYWIGGDIYICHCFFPLAVSVDLSAFPDLTISEVEPYAQKGSGCRHTTKGYKFFAEPGYLHDVKAELSYSKKINCEYTYTFLFESCSCCCFCVCCIYNACRHLDKL